MASVVVKGTVDAGSIQWTTGAIILAVASGGTDTASLTRRNRITAGDFSATPFATLQAAIDALPKGYEHDVIIRVGAGTFDGAFAWGTVGKGRLRIACSSALATLASGSNAGTAGSGTTTTVMAKPTAAANWTAADLRDKLLRINSGGGASGDADFPTLRPIKSNTTTTLTVDAIPGMDDTTVFQIVDVATVFTPAAVEPFGFVARLGFVGCVNPIEVTLAKVNESAGEAGVFAYRCEAVTLTGLDAAASSGNAVEIMTCGEASINDSIIDGPVSVLACNWHLGQNLVIQAAGGLTIDGCAIAEVLADAAGCVPNAVVMKNCDRGLLGLNAVNCTATPCVLQNVRYFSIDSYLSGANPGTAYGADISRSGQYVISGATISGSDTNEFLIEGAEGSWAQISAQGAHSARGGSTVMHWGSGFTFMRGSHATESDLLVGGRQSNFGFVANPIDATVTAFAGGGQGSAVQLGYNTTRVTTVAETGDSVKYNSGFVTGGIEQIVFNDGDNFMDLFPASGNFINDLAANAPLSVPPGSMVYGRTITGGLIRSFINEGAFDPRRGTELFSDMIDWDGIRSGPFILDVETSGDGTLVDAEADAPGIFRLTTGTSTDGNASLCTAAANALTVEAGGPTRFACRFRIGDVTDTGGNDYDIYIGLFSDVAGADLSPNDGIYLIWRPYDETTFATETTAAGSNTTTATAVTPVDAQWYTLEIIINAAQDSVKFFIDGVLVNTHTANIPASVPMGISHRIIKSAGTDARHVDIDYSHLRAYLARA